ncbi:uncharacterized mitochondrial protein-like protein [Tanacetum coccineum]|uniref:Uncharacterized mitochondrial protein-like protein n=1 Tax=Tanacetum coccineum TaxID=301880 RepID=A0ABQ5A9W3_9ASTR
MDYIKLLELGMKPCQHIYWTMGFKEGKLTRPYSSKGTKMSSMGELTFFLGLQVQQKKDGIFISQDKYVVEILKKFGFTEVKTASTPMETQKPLLPRMRWYLKGQPKLGLWYLKDSPFDLVAYTDSDYAGASLDRKSTTGVLLVILNTAEFLLLVILNTVSSKTTAWNEFSSTMASAIICLATNQKFNFSKYIFKSMVRNLDDLSGKFLMYPRFVQVFLEQQLDDMPSHKRIYIAPSHTKKIFGNMRRAGKDFSGKVTDLFPTMLVQNQMGEGSAMPTDPQHTPTFIQPSPPPQKTQKPRKPKRKDTQVPQPSGPTDIVADEAVHKELGDSLVRAATTASSLEAEQDSGNITKTRSKATPNESSSLGTTSGGGPRCQETIGDTIAQTRVLDLEKTKTTQQNKIASLKRRVKKLEQKKRSRTHGLKRLHKVDDADNEMFDVDALNDEEVFVAEQEVANEKDDDGEITLAQALIEMKSTKPKVKGVVIQEPGESTTTKSSQLSSQQSQDKGKGIMIEEPMKPNKKDVQIILDEEAAKRLQAEFDEEERLAREKDEANVALTEEWDDIQAKIEADHELAQRLQAEEQEELSDAEKATLFQQLLEKRRKHFAAKRAEEQRNKPPTQAQQRKIMCTYLKNMEGKKLKDLKNKSFDSIQKMFDRAFMRCDHCWTSEQTWWKVVQREQEKNEEEVAIDVVPLAIKSPSIVGWKIHKEGKKSYYQIMRADGKSQMYRIFSHMLKSFSREDLEDLYKLVKAKYESTRPVEDLDLLLWGDLKTMFEPHVEDTVWRNQQDYKVLEWKLYDSCGVHSLRMQHVYIYMLVEKRYPLTPSTITDMLNKKLQGRIVGIKSLLNAASITAAHIRVNAAQLC